MSKFCAGVEEVLAVVQDEQSLPVAQVTHEYFDDLDLWLFPDTPRRCDIVRNDPRVGELSEVAEADTARAVEERSAHGFEGESRLAAAANTGQGEQSSLAEQAFDLRQL